MKIELVTITPDMARDWLNDNTNNRRVRESHIRMLAKAMRAGEWKLLHQPIAFDEKGVLLDGQHRLRAVLESGVTIDSLVCYEALRDSFDCIDIGAKRNLADITGIRPDLAAALRVVATIAFDDPAVSPQQCERVWPHIKSQLNALIEETSAKRRYITTGTIMAAAAIRLVSGENKQYVLSVWRNLVAMNFQDLPPVAGSFVRQLMDGKRSSPRLGFARAWKTFEEASSDVARLMVADPDDAWIAARAVVITSMGLKIAPLGVAAKKRTAA